MLPEVQTIDHASPYATKQDFCRIFTENVSGLYHLAFLLTSNGPKAEECFLSALGECHRASRVFNEWARSWSRRAVILQAAKMIEPARPEATLGRAQVVASKLERGVARFPLGPVLALAPFERFVFVMSVLERWSDQECSVALGCSRAEIERARVAAIEGLASRGAMSSPVVLAGSAAAAAMTA